MNARNAGQALILNIRRNSLDDGPGIRTTVFFKGCPLNCIWCHNPESKKAKPELSYDAAVCVGCGTCAWGCPESAISENNPYFVDREKCSLCFKCAEACPSRALKRMGTPMTVAEVVESALKDAAFYRSSGGGVTLSGGEPTAYMEFCSELMSELCSAGVDTLVETCGLFDFDRFSLLILPYASRIFIDIKLMDSARHKEMCGADNRVILSNARRLIEASAQGGPEILPRIPLIPGATDTDENLAASAAFLMDCGATRVSLLSYNPTWTDKMRMLGEETKFAASSWTSAEKMESCRAFFKDFEIVR
ncbi:MAG TPA: glycyl-radical enzyme activating protein [bacterium]|nr:glycyl-radical enzyme activating protein [bacterium]